VKKEELKPEKELTKEEEKKEVVKKEEQEVKRKSRLEAMTNVEANIAGQTLNTLSILSERESRQKVIVFLVEDLRTEEKVKIHSEGIAGLPEKERFETIGKTIEKIEQPDERRRAVSQIVKNVPEEEKTQFIEEVAKDSPQAVQSAFVKSIENAPAAIGRAFVGIASSVLQKVFEETPPENLPQISRAISQAAEKVVDPPLIAGEFPNIEVKGLQATILWVTDKPSNSIVALSPAALYDPSFADPYITQTGNADELAVNHKVELLNLSPGTLYHIQVRSKAQVGPEARSIDRTFQTGAEEPVIQRVALPTIKEKEAEISWSTNVSADSIIEYTNLQTGETKVYGEQFLIRDHAILLKDLEPKSTYQVSIKSKDEFGAVAESSPLTFSTSIDDAPPHITRVQTESAISPKGDKIQTLISWQTDEPATGQVFYKEGIIQAGEFSFTPKDQALSLHHLVVVTQFKPATVYRFFVESEDSSKNKARSKDFTILTPRQTETVLQVIIKNFEETFEFTKRLRF
jgi:hypothetical protein